MQKGWMSLNDVAGDASARNARNSARREQERVPYIPPSRGGSAILPPPPRAGFPDESDMRIAREVSLEGNPLDVKGRPAPQPVAAPQPAAVPQSGIDALERRLADMQQRLTALEALAREMEAIRAQAAPASRSEPDAAQPDEAAAEQPTAEPDAAAQD